MKKRTIIKFDRDYGELIFKKGFKPEAGVIYFRWEEFIPAQPGNYLIKLIEIKKLHFNNMLTVISEKNIQQRKF